jgi:hypothetical protein
MEARRTVKKLTEWEPGAVRPVGRPSLRWLDQVEEDLMRMTVRNWRETERVRSVWIEDCGMKPQSRSKPTKGCSAERRSV